MPDGCKGGYGEKHIMVYLLNKTKTTSATPKKSGLAETPSLAGPDSIFRIDLRGHGMLISINTPTSQGMDYGVAGFINSTDHSTC